MTEAAQAVDRRRWRALAVLCFAQLMLSVDISVVNIALPSIQHQLHFSSASLAWVVNAYLITFAGFLLFAGRLGDLVGRRRVFVSGLVMFTAASALCGASQSAVMLVAARLLQGVGAATAGSVIVALIATIFPGGPNQAKAIGYLTFTAVSGSALGLLVGGALTQGLGWHWIFFINLPIGIVVIPLAQRLIEPHDGIGLGNGVDALGAVLVTAALVLGCYAIVEASSRGWTSAVTLGGGGGALALLALFIARERMIAFPMLALRIFRSPNVSGANVARAVMALANYGTIFLLSLYLQEHRHYTPLATGLAFLPMMGSVAVFSLGVSARLVSLVGAKLTLLIGYVSVIGGVLVLAQLSVHGSYVADVLPALLLIGAGSPLAFNPAVMLSMGDVPPADFGVASGMSNVSHQVGGAIGLALVATLSATRARDLLAAGHYAASAAVGGDSFALTVVAALLVAAFVASALVLRPRQGSDTIHRTEMPDISQPDI